MNVPNIRQDPGSVTALPRAGADGDPFAGRAASAVRAHSAAHVPAPTVSFTRLAWFDVNGDGHIDPRSASAGGDATLLVPSDAVDLPTTSRTVTAFGSGQLSKGVDSDRGTPANPAQTNRAVDAYQRYGQAPPAAPIAPTAPAAPAAPTAPAPTAAAPGPDPASLPAPAAPQLAVA